MRKPLPRLALAVLFIASGLLYAHGATGTRHRNNVTKAFNAIEEGTISAVNGASITVTHVKQKAQRPTGAKAPTASKAAPKKTAVPHATDKKTYEISDLTDIEVDGQKADVNALKVGMAVSISADPPLGLSPINQSDGGEARVILAHAAPPKPSPSPAKGKQTPSKRK